MPLKTNFKNLLEKRKHKTLFRVGLVLFLAFGSLLFTPTPAHGETTQGLTQDVYIYDSSALPDRVNTYTLCNTSVVPNINFDVGGDVVAGCQEDFVLIHWYGYITLPANGEITFQSMADDGFYMAIGDSVVIDNWWLKGCSGGTGTHTFQAGVSQPVDIWWYEYGGGACNLLYYSDPVTAFTLIPDSAWSMDVVPIVEPPVVEPPVVDPPIDPEPPVVDPVDPTPVDPEPVTPEPPVEPVIPDPPVVPEPPVVAPTVPTEPEKPIIEPVLPEPTPTESLNILVDIAPSEMTEAQVEELKEVAISILETTEQGSPEYEAALDALFVAAQADDIVLSEELVAVPVIGAVAEGVVNAINFIGNVGSDMSPQVREKSEKIVVSAVVVAQVAATAMMTTASVSTGGIRRIK